MKEYAERTSRKRGQKPSDAVPQRLKDHVRIYFPTERTVANSRGGRGVSARTCDPQKTETKRSAGVGGVGEPSLPFPCPSMTRLGTSVPSYIRGAEGRKGYPYLGAAQHGWR